MTGLKNFWVEDLEEYAGYRFVPLDSDASLSVMTENKNLYQELGEEYSLNQFKRVVFHYSVDMPVEISVPPNLTIKPEKLDEMWKDTAEAHEYISDLEERSNSADGFSSIILEFLKSYIKFLNKANEKRPALSRSFCVCKIF